MIFLKWKSPYVGGVTGFSAFRRRRRISRRRMTKEEYEQLKQMVPSIATHTRVSKVKPSPYLEVIDKVIKQGHAQFWTFCFYSFSNRQLFILPLLLIYCYYQTYWSNFQFLLNDRFEWLKRQSNTSIHSIWFSMRDSCHRIHQQVNL